MMPSDHGSQLDELRDVVGEIDALAALAVDSLDDTDWRGSRTRCRAWPRREAS